MALRTYLTGIADAIREKKGTTDPINAQDFASEISSISTGGGGENPLQALVDGKGGYYLCAGYTGTNADFLNRIDFSATTNTSYMFNNCSKITTIPLIDTSSVTNMNSMFSNCYRLTSLPQLNTSSATNMNGTFGNCSKITTIPLIDTSSVTDMGFIFNGCSKLLTIDITKLANNANYFAGSCYALIKVIIRTMDTIPTLGANSFQNCYHFTGTVNSTYNPEGLDDGRIYVPDDKVDALKAATGWSEFADNIVPLSTLVED